MSIYYPMFLKSSEIAFLNFSKEIKYLSQPSDNAKKWFPIPEINEVNLEKRINLHEINITEAYLKTLYNYLDNALINFTGFSKEKCSGFVAAFSGGIDSAVIVKLLRDYCQTKGSILKILIMGEGDHDTTAEEYHGTPAEWADIQYAKFMCDECGLEYDYLDIKEDLRASTRYYFSNWARGGQRPRIRANHLYAMAEEHDLISVGSTNGSEFILAAFSTGGPAGNIAPLLDLYKTEVYAIARDIDVPKFIQDRKPLISELNLADCSLYGGDNIDSTIIDPIIRRLWYFKQSPAQIARELGHSERWIADINAKRIVGEACRRNYKGLTINRSHKFDDSNPDLFLDRSYFI